jgi:hypothetical protein
MDIALGNERLLELAAILDVADAQHRQRKEPTYDQSVIVHDCGTPACAAGHWAASNPDRWEIRGGCTYLKGRSSMGAIPAMSNEFALSIDEYEELFGSAGCNGARTAKQAAKYIRRFVSQRQKSIS